MTKEMYDKSLLGSAWIILPPDTCMEEIEVAMVKIGAEDKFFTFKPISPIFSTMEAKLTEPEYWKNFEWTFKK